MRREASRRPRARAGRPRPRPDSPKALVRKGWNRASLIYRPDDARRDVFGSSFQDHRRWLGPILQGLPPGARVLDLGCGCGVPDCAILAERFDVTGIDISDVQIKRAVRLVPRAHFQRADMTEVEFPSAGFDAITCLFALIHIPLEEQPRLLRRIRDWLRPGGLCLITTGHTAWTGVERDWLGGGAPMYWSHAAADTYERWFLELGFTVVRRSTVLERKTRTEHELFWLRIPDPNVLARAI
jgi:SAM-dependent methyltransferase